MDVHGLKPDSKAGKYFRASMWAWPPIWDFAVTVAPEITERVTNGDPYGNEGAGLTEPDDAKALGQAILDGLERYPGLDHFQTANEDVSPFFQDCFAMFRKQFGQPFIDEYGENPFFCKRPMVEEFGRFCLHSGGFKIT